MKIRRKQPVKKGDSDKKWYTSLPTELVLDMGIFSGCGAGLTYLAYGDPVPGAAAGAAFGASVTGFFRGLYYKLTRPVVERPVPEKTTQTGYLGLRAQEEAKGDPEEIFISMKPYNGEPFEIMTLSSSGSTIKHDSG